MISVCFNTLSMVFYVSLCVRVRVRVYATHEWITAGLLPCILFHGRPISSSLSSSSRTWMECQEGKVITGRVCVCVCECVHSCVLYMSVCVHIYSRGERCVNVMLHDTAGDELRKYIQFNHFTVSTLGHLISAFHKPFLPCFLSFSPHYLQKECGLSGTQKILFISG